MKALKKDVAGGYMRLRIETLDDLWHLRNLIMPGDLVSMDTYRTAEASTDKLREGKAEKKRMRLGVRVESIAWHDFDDHLRVLGTIESGPQDHGRHHTHIVRDDPQAPVDIAKPGPLQRWQLELLDQAQSESKSPQVILLAIDDAEAQFAILRSYGLQWLGSLPATGQGKQFDGAAAAKANFYKEAAKTLATLREPGVAVVVVGPGWWREEFLATLNDSNILTDGTSQGGRGGIHEAMKRGIVDRVARDHRVHWETQRIEQLFTAIATDSPVAYGPDEVRDAVTAGAAEEVLVSDEAIRANRFEATLQEADRTRCTVHIVGTSHDAGVRLEQLGGIAAILRFRV